MPERQSSKKFFSIVFLTSLFTIISSADLTNLCSSTTPSCNCTLINNIDLTITCNPAVPLTQLPVLQPNTLQTSVTQLRLSSSVVNTKGPLIRFPSNICSYLNVQILDLSFNNINGLFNTTELACLASRLLQIDLSSNAINEVEKNFFQANTRLQKINLSSNNLTTMPLIDGDYFVAFPTSVNSMNFSSNQITRVDLWPIFVRTGNQMIIDMSFNLIENYTNTVPISLAQFDKTPDPRYFYLNNNRLTYFSDLLLEQYGACSTTSPLSTAYFVVGISNILLKNNNLTCDCQSYNLISYIQDRINDFPQIYNGTALLTQATCSALGSFAGQPYLSIDFTLLNNCDDYELPNISDIFCSLISNDTRVTLTTPTYWPSTTTPDPSATNGSANTNARGSESSSTASSWYIILGVVLGLALIVGVVIGICCLFREKLFRKKYGSKLLDHVRIDGNSVDKSYAQMTRSSETSTEKNLKMNGIKPHRSSMSPSTDGSNEHGKGTPHMDHGGLQAGREIGNDENQETQTNFPVHRSKPPTGRRLSSRASHSRENKKNLPRERKFSLPVSTDAATNTINIVKGIPISIAPPKAAHIPSSESEKAAADTSTSDSSAALAPSAPSKRAKILPPVKKGIYDDSTNDHLLNTSAGALVTSQRQRRRSALWFRRQHPNMISPLPPRPQSDVIQKTNFDYDGSFDEDKPSIPTIEGLTNKPLKPLRTVPLLNISVVPAWADDSAEQM